METYWFDLVGALHKGVKPENQQGAGFTSEDVLPGFAISADGYEGAESSTHFDVELEVLSDESLKVTLQTSWTEHGGGCSDDEPCSCQDRHESETRVYASLANWLAAKPQAEGA